MGKTRLALRLASDLWDEFDGEVFVVELAPVHDPTSTVAAIATAIDVQQRQHLSVEETLVEYLRARKVLLVLDNCEHLRAAVAPLADRLLGLCPEVTVLATSREVLGLPSEQVWRVEPLEIAPEGADRRPSPTPPRPGCSSSAPPRPDRASIPSPTTSAPSPRSCAGSTGCRSPSSWRRRASGR